MNSILRVLPRPSLSRLDVVVLIGIIGVLAGLLIPVGEHDPTHHYPPAKAGAGIPLADLAGEYLQRTGRGGHGWVLSILPDGRYSRFLESCTGTGERESGHAEILAGHCILVPAGSFSTSMEVDRDFLPIRWKERLYLVPPDRMQEFCYAVIEGQEPRPSGEMGERFLLRSPAAQVDGIPELPEPWETFLRENLVIGKVVEVMDGNRLRIDLGWADGIETGDVLAVQGRSEWQTRHVGVQSVQDHSSVAEETSWEHEKIPLEVGRYVVMKRDLGNSEKLGPTDGSRHSTSTSSSSQPAPVRP
jgi:hypothetical protein